MSLPAHYERNGSRAMTITRVALTADTPVQILPANPRRRRVFLGIAHATPELITLGREATNLASTGFPTTLGQTPATGLELRTQDAIWMVASAGVTKVVVALEEVD